MLNNLAVALPSPSKDAAAEKLYQQAIDIRRRLGDRHPDAFAQVLWNKAFVINGQGRCPEAELLYVEAEMKAQNTSVLRGDSGINFFRCYAGCLMQLGKFAQAEERFRQMLDLVRKQPNYPAAARADRLLEMANVLQMQAKWADAVPFLQEATRQKGLLYEAPIRQLGCVQKMLGQESQVKQQMTLLKSAFGKDRRLWLLVRLARINALLGTQTPKEVEDSLWVCVADLAANPSDYTACTLVLNLLRRQ